MYNILIADDDRIILELYKGIFRRKKDFDFLTDEKFSLKTFNDGKYLLEYFKKEYEKGSKTVLAILDMRMPILDGLKTATEIRKIDEDVIIIIATAYSDISLKTIRESLKRDIYYMNKPFDKESFFCLVDSLVKNWKKNKELKDAREKMVRQEKLALMGQLSGSVGHELRTPLCIISNTAYLLRNMLLQKDPEYDSYFDIIFSEIKRASRIVSDLLDFSRIKSINKSNIKAEKLISQVLERVKPPEEIKIVKYIKDVSLFVDVQQLEHVLLNLTANAYQAIEGEGEVIIEAEEKDGSIHISVSDTGSGIAGDKLDSIFDPLFTTKSKGTGLGLTICKNLIEANGGILKVESQEGRGSTFSIILPLQ